MNSEVVELLGGVELFGALPTDELRRLAESVRIVRLPAGAWLFRQHEPADSLHIIRSGRVDVVIESPPMSRVVGVAGRGAVVGEFGIIADCVRTASVRARRDTETVEVTRERFVEALNRHPAVAVALARLLAGRIVATDALRSVVQTRTRTIALVALAGDLPLENAVDELARALRRYATTAVLRDGLEPVTDEPPGRILDRLECDHDYVILPCRGTTGSWFEFCVRQADRLIVLAHPSSTPPDETCQVLLRGCDVLMTGMPPADALMSALAPRTHEWPEIHAPTRPAVDRLARRLLGRSVGVVLSGGGARTLAHIGVLEVMMERGVIVDRIGGCSMGALIAALVAEGRSPDQMVDILRSELVLRNPFRDFTFPRVALLRGRQLTAMLTRLFGETRMEDLPIDCYCVSADLLTADLVVHRTGDVRTALAATMSVPGVTPPVATDGRLLVDGGVLDNLPIAPMAAIAAGPVVAVDVMRQLPVARRGEGLLLMDVLLRSTVLGSRHASALAAPQVSVAINPQVQDIGLRDFRQIDRAVEAGRRAARSILDQHDLASASVY